MIVANRKPFEEIVEMVKPYKSILLLGCNECVTVCAAGGAKEVAVLASELRLHREKEGQPIEVKEHVLERNCDPEYVESLAAVLGDVEAVLSMACGCGIQFVGEHYRNMLVLPAVNTTFDGVTEEARRLGGALSRLRQLHPRQDARHLSCHPLREEPL